MSWQQAVMWAVVSLVGLPAAWRNVTSAALVASWALAQGIWVITGDNLPLQFYVMADIGVLTAIYAKTIARCGPKVYRDGWEQLRCMITDLSVWDRWIAGSFVFLTWPLYVLTFDPWFQWMCLWAVTIAQFCVAGAESFITWRKTNGSITEPAPPGSGSLRFAVGGRGNGV